MTELATVEQAVTRTSDDGKYSKQPRFHTDQQSLWNAFVSFMKRTTEDLQIPPYVPNSMTRDRWLQTHWPLEPHWSGVVSQCVQIDSSRAWEMIGGRNQVRRFTEMLHQADGGKGWRHFFRRQSLSYRTNDMGAITELGRDGENGPLRAIYHADASRCRWTGNPEFTLEYNPSTGSSQLWTGDDFFNVTSLPNPREEYNGLGFCQTSRAWDLLRLFYAVLMHDQELTGARMPKGIMFLHNITEPQWDTVIRGRDAKLDGANAHYFGGLMVIAGAGDDLPDGKMVALSQLPANFDRRTFIDQTMWGYALVANYDPREFWPVSGGALGTATETEQQHRKAIGKGSVEFPQAWQERFNQELPPTLVFQFEQRDAEGELLDAEVAQAWANVGKTLYEAGGVFGLPLLDRQETLEFLAKKSSLLNPEDVELMEQTIATDEEPQEQMERIRQIPQVQRAIKLYPDEPIVRYRYQWPMATEHVLWERGSDALRPKVWRGGIKGAADWYSRQTLPVRNRYWELLRQGVSVEQARLLAVKRQEPEIFYASPDGEVVITSDDVDRAVVDWDRSPQMPEDSEGLLEAQSIE